MIYMCDVSQYMQPTSGVSQTWNVRMSGEGQGIFLMGRVKRVSYM